MGAADDLLLLAEIIAAGGLTAASRKTGISKSTLSRRMDDLEKALGGHLLHRGPKRFSATEVGISVYERGLKIKDELRAVTGIVEGHTRHPTGPLRIACPKVLSELIICDFAVAFAKEHRDVRVALDTSGGSFQAKIDHYDIVIQPVRESLANSELIRRKLFVAPYVLVGAPDLVKSFGKQALTPNKLDRCPGIGWAADDFSSRWKLVYADSSGKCACRQGIPSPKASTCLPARASVYGRLMLTKRRVLLDSSTNKLRNPELVSPSWRPPAGERARILALDVF
jgi:DNA-binding transcriptional LysR family regulator